ncbi:hypothetical protein Fcan01_25918 [Folsomia candida]|uniref:Uncharacterized protein n=1 Tax=Folsomia candida TaxID=158441 RepID=A0A226D380_FOLCA|nr:hypothetical protein Fcan01_25918 [Folsomia candida]
MWRITLIPLITLSFSLHTLSLTVRIDRLLEKVETCQTFLIHGGLATENLKNDVYTNSQMWRGGYIYFFAPLRHRISGNYSHIALTRKEIRLLTPLFKIHHYKSLRCLYVINYLNSAGNLGGIEPVIAEFEMSKYLILAADQLIIFPSRREVMVGTLGYLYLLWIHQSLTRPPYSAASFELQLYKYVVIISIDTVVKGRIIYLRACYACKTLNLVRIADSKIEHIYRPLSALMQQEMGRFKIIWKFIAGREFTQFSGIVTPLGAKKYLKDFEKIHDIDATLSIISLLIQFTNSTGRVCAEMDDFGMTPCDGRIEEERGKVTNHIKIGIELRDGYYLDWVTTTSTGYDFMTCWSQVESGFRYYVAPFRWEVWLLIGIAGFFSSMVLVLVLRIQNISNVSTSFPVLLLISTFFEETLQIPTVLWKQREFRIVFGLWCVACITLTNGYIGVSITKLSSPLAKYAVSEFADLTKPLCRKDEDQECTQKLFNPLIFAYYVHNLPRFPENRSITMLNPANVSLHHAVRHREFDQSTDFVILPYYPLASAYVENIEENSFFGKLSKHMEFLFDKMQIEFRNLSKFDKTVANLVNPLHLTHPLLPVSPGFEVEHDYDIEKLIVQCGRTVFVQRREIIEKEITYFRRNYDSIHFFKGSETIFSGVLGWGFKTRGEMGQKIVTIFKRGVFESGIFAELEDRRNFAASKARKNITRIVKKLIGYRNKMEGGMSMEGTIHTVFVIAGVLWVLGLIVFTVEIALDCWSRIKILMPCFNLIISVFSEPLNDS